MKTNNHKSLLLNCLLLICVFAICFDCRQSQSSKVVVQTSKGTYHFKVEIADREDSRQKGLMFRQELPPNSGMLFVWPHDERVTFWMKNTLIPLDILFINSNDKIIHIEENTKPFSTEQMSPKDLVRYVLEVNAGFVELSGVAIGDGIFFEDY